MIIGSWRAWSCSALLVLGACATSEDCQSTDHCEGNTAVRCPGYTRGALFGGEGHLEREDCDNDRRCVESTTPLARASAIAGVRGHRSALTQP